MPGGNPRSTFTRCASWLLRPVLASLALLVGAAAAPARVSDDVRAAALHNVDGNLGDAIKLEQNAVYLVDHGNEAGARSEIKNSEQLLNKALPAAKALTTPPELRQFAPPDTSWDRVEENTNSAITWDKRALEQSGGALATYVGIALKKKEAVYSLVHAEITHPMCSELINLQGPITVNGVPQGGSQLSVDVACSRPVGKLIIVLPMATITKMIHGRAGRDRDTQPGRRHEDQDGRQLRRGDGGDGQARDGHTRD